MPKVLICLSSYISIGKSFAMIDFNK